MAALPEAYYWIGIVVIAFVGIALLVLGALALARLRDLAAARESALRDAADLRLQLEVIKTQGVDLERDLKQDMALARTEHLAMATSARTELAASLAQSGQAMHQQLATMSAGQIEYLQNLAQALAKLTQSNEQRLDSVRVTIEQRLDVLRNENAVKLDAMRATVDEKLSETLQTRLSESFKQVSERLEQVHRGLGEMQSLATGVGDLKRVLTNVKTRGTWGEVQLGTLLSEVLTPQQFGANVETVPGSGKRVEFAIRLPGRSDDGQPCWLPVDAKFPLDDWQRLQDALERADAPAADQARKALAEFLKLQAKTIRESYVAPPFTTDFALLFVPTEGLYAEMMSRPGFAEMLQREYRVTLTGPTNFLALLNSLQMGFRTLAIEQRSSEAWKVLGAVKTEFGKFGDVLARTQKKLDEASATINEARGKSTTISRRLREVEALPEGDAQHLLGPSFAAGPDGEPPLDVK
jgi:DNA recombination protein RmuC